MVPMKPLIPELCLARSSHEGKQSCKRGEGSQVYTNIWCTFKSLACI